QGVCDTGRRRLGRQAWQASGLVARSRSRVVGRSADVTRPDGRLLAQTEAELGSQRRRRRRGCGVVGLANCRRISSTKQLVYRALVDGRDAPVGREPCPQAVAKLNRVHSNPSSAVVPRTQHVPVARRRHWTLGWSRETFGWGLGRGAGGLRGHFAWLRQKTALRATASRWRHLRASRLSGSALEAADRTVAARRPVVASELLAEPPALQPSELRRRSGGDTVERPGSACN